MSFIRFGSLKVKLQSYFEDVSVLKVSNLNTNYAIKFYKCSGRKLLSNVHQKMTFYTKRPGNAFSCLWLFTHLLFNERTVSLGENSSKRNY